jgi:hypothetical protein
VTALPQHMEALQRANDVRKHNSDLKADLAALSRGNGAVMLANLLCEEPDSLFGAMPVQSALRAIRGIGREKAGTILIAAGVKGVTRRVRDLTVRQREFIALALRSYT